MRDSLEAQRLASLLISCSVTSGPASTRPSGLTITLPRRISMVCGSADRLPGSPDNPRDNRRDEYISGPRVLAARRVGPTGKAYGLDMTDEMLALAEENRRKSGLTNVEFLKGEIKFFPLSRSPSRRRISLQR